MSPLTKRKYTSITLGILFFLLIPVWFFVVQPHIYLLAKDFSFSADIISYDNFYDKEEKVCAQAAHVNGKVNSDQ